MAVPEPAECGGAEDDRSSTSATVVALTSGSSLSSTTVVPRATMLTIRSMPSRTVRRPGMSALPPFCHRTADFRRP